MSDAVYYTPFEKNLPMFRVGKLLLGSPQLGLYCTEFNFWHIDFATIPDIFVKNDIKISILMVTDNLC